MRLIPLGGLGEIGLNMMLVECGPDILAVDCGLLFPDDEMLGVDFAIPDFSYLKERRDAFRAVVLTHGHEDHIGALSYLLRDFPVPAHECLPCSAPGRIPHRSHRTGQPNARPPPPIPRACQGLGHLGAGRADLPAQRFIHVERPDGQQPAATVSSAPPPRPARPRCHRRTI